MQLAEALAIDELEITDLEVLQAAEQFGFSKAPGLDGISKKTIKTAIKYNTKPFTDLLTRCLRDFVFPKIWKMYRLVLLQNTNKTVEEPSSYRPVCLIDSLGKIPEPLICARLESHLELGTCSISDNLYGFKHINQGKTDSPINWKCERLGETKFYMTQFLTAHGTSFMTTV